MKIATNKKAFDFEVKTITKNEDETLGIITGLGSVYDITDSYGDIVKSGAFTKSLEITKQYPALFNHSVNQPIGINNVKDSGEGLITEIDINLETQLGRETYALAKQGAITGLSIGYKLKEYVVTDKKYNDWPVWELTEIDLKEISLVTFPANEEAIVTNVKNEDEEKKKIKQEKKMSKKADVLAKYNEIHEQIKKAESTEEVKALTLEASKLQSEIDLGANPKSNVHVKEVTNVKTELKTETENKYKYRDIFYKKLRGQELQKGENEFLTKYWGIDGNTGQTSDASPAIPETTMDLIIAKLEQTNILYSRIAKSVVNGNLKMIVEGEFDDVQWGVPGEGQEVTAETGDIVTVEFGQYKIIKLVSVSREALLMTIPAFEKFIVNEIVRKLGKEIDRGIATGTGVNQPTGLFVDTKITNTIELDPANITAVTPSDIMAEIGSQYEANAVQIMNKRTWYKKFDGLVDSAGQKIGFTSLSNAQDKFLNGVPVVLSDYVPAFDSAEAITLGYILYGNLDYYHMNQNQLTKLESSTQSSFKTDLVDYKGTFLADSKVLDGRAFVKVTAPVIAAFGVKKPKATETK